MNLQQIADLSESNVSEFYKLPPPDTKLIEEADEEILHRLTFTLSRQWVSIVTRKIELSTESLVILEKDDSETKLDETIKDRVLLNIGLYYDFVVRRLLALNKRSPDPRDLRSLEI